MGKENSNLSSDLKIHIKRSNPRAKAPAKMNSSKQDTGKMIMADVPPLTRCTTNELITPPKRKAKQAIPRLKSSEVGFRARPVRIDETLKLESVRRSAGGSLHVMREALPQWNTADDEAAPNAVAEQGDTGSN